MPVLFGVLMGLIEHSGDGSGSGGGIDGISIHNESSNATLRAEENRRIIAYCTGYVLTYCTPRTGYCTVLYGVTVSRCLVRECVVM